MSYEDSVLDEAKIRAYAQRVARELNIKFEAEDHWFDQQVTEEVWVDEIVNEPRWFGLRSVEVTRRVKRPQSATRRVKASPPSGWILASTTSNHRNRLQKRGDYGEETYRTTYWLRSNGELMIESDYNYDGILDGRYFQGSQTNDSGSMSVADILWFDRGRGGQVWAPSKGVGLHARLSKLRKTGQ